ncbi:MAG: M48 family metalloprotease [Pseudomonadota bacterium]
MPALKTELCDRQRRQGRDGAQAAPYMFGMIKFLFPILLIAAMVVFWKIRAQSSGHALRGKSRPLQNDQLEAMFARLANAAGIDRVEVRLLEDSGINGLATDTGEIYVTEGLLEQFRTGAVSAREIASVAAHEMGHLALGHMKRRMVEVAGRQAAHIVLGAVVGRIIPFFGHYVVAWLLNLVTAKLSRRDEFEADAYATALMVRSGLGAEAQATLLEKLPKLIPGASAPQAVSWLASHPPVDERATAIRANAERWQDHAPMPAQRPTPEGGQT